MSESTRVNVASGAWPQSHIRTSADHRIGQFKANMKVD
jgi:hypothetical protein